MKENNKIIVGIGHPMRGDDSIGPKIIDLLSEDVTNLFKTQKCLGDMVEILDIFSNHEQVVLVDAIFTQDNEPGTCYRLQQDEITNIIGQCRVSTHAFDLSQTLEMAKQLNMLPKSLIIYGIEAQDFTHGATLSPKVAKAIPKLLEQIKKEIVSP